MFRLLHYTVEHDLQSCIPGRLAHTVWRRKEGKGTTTVVGEHRSVDNLKRTGHAEVLHPTQYSREQMERIVAQTLHPASRRGQVQQFLVLDHLLRNIVGSL